MTLLRTESFVPLTNLPDSSEQREFHITVIPRADSAHSLPSADHAAPAPPLSGSGAEKICEPRVYLQSEGDRISSIRVQCSCGQVMDLACVYDPATKPA